MTKLTLIKLGGSLLTNKSKLFTLKEDVLESVIGQLVKAWSEGERFVLGHGSGSFAHVPAEKYKVIQGKIDEQSVYGASMVADAAAQLNRIVIAESLKQKLSTISLPPSSLFISKSKQASEVNLLPIVTSLNIDLVPVVYGDLILDLDQGFTIWSTESVLNTIANNWQDDQYQITKVIHCGETDGFLVKDQVVPEINTNNFEEMKQSISETAGFDVTGGMLHKIEESLSLARTKQIDSYIVGGNHGGNLYRAITGKDFIGTRVTT